VLAGLWVVRLGLFILAGHSEIEVAHGWLHAIERAGPVRWSRRRRIDDIRRLAVKRAADAQDRQPAEVRHLARLPIDLSAIAVECEKKSPLLAAAGYPHEWLLALAHDLSRRCELAALESPNKPRIVVADLGDEQAQQAEALQKPAGSNITLEEHADGVTLHVPPAGLWKGSKGLFAFSLLWNGFMTIVTGGFVWALLAGGAGHLDALIFVAFIAAFWAVGLGLMLAGINMGRRCAVLGVVGNDHLLVLQTGIFGSKRREWDRGQLEEIRAGPSGIETNGVPIIELQIIPRRGKKVGLLAGRENDELHWLAAVLRHSLRLDQPDGARECNSGS
jgi:hypothetical protein